MFDRGCAPPCGNMWVSASSLDRIRACKAHAMQAGATMSIVVCMPVHSVLAHIHTWEIYVCFTTCGWPEHSPQSTLQPP